MRFKVHFKPFLAFFVGFMLFTVIGTLSHEYGHILVAKYFGYETTLHYASMNYNYDAGTFEGIQKHKETELWVVLGGPFQTMLTGTVGLLLLMYKRKGRIQSKFNFMDWLVVFLSLFWLREVFNLLVSVFREVLYPDGSFFGGDEKRLSLMLDLWPGTIPIVLGAFGCFISALVVFKLIPKAYQLTFILSGLLGGIVGFILWMYFLGPILMP